MDNTKFILKLIFIVLTTPLWILPLFVFICLIAYAEAKYDMFKEENGLGEYDY
ncbi:hypothetical protein HN588_11150 [Candidatus Bathyarchaeota archaeon]|jgi:hypothetical protein|nr:hypothetical protein [Candidatus Bathyarchaeota archaeon]